MGDLPEGLLTFLFSDIEGSTRLWEQRPDEMRPALTAHDLLVIDAVGGAGGHMVKSTGDGFMAVFVHPAAAVEAACNISRRLAGLNEGWLRARMGIHTGESSLRDGDYFGTEVNRAARLMDAANGGQVVLSEITRSLVGSALPEGVAVIEAGRHRLKDLADPIAVFQLSGDFFDDRRPLRTLDFTAHNLPLQVSSFVGRTTAMSELVELVPTHRLTTLTGVGGIGKTSLAIQVARALLERFADGAWLIEFAAVRDPTVVAARIADAVGTRDIGYDSTADALEAYLKGRSLLLVLDNCEHLVEPIAALVHRLLTRCAGLTVLTTSQRRLGLAEETVIPIPRLGLDGLAGSAQELFMIRAKQLSPDFIAKGSEVEMITDICRRLDGLPLAVELAAARTEILSIAEMHRQLDNLSSVLGSRYDADERHRTLEAAITWSFELLSEPARHLLMCATVFRGSFTSSGLAAVSGWSLADKVMPALSELVRSSLAVTMGNGRFGLMETVRQFAALLSDSDLAESLRARHARHFRRVVAGGGLGLVGQERVDWRSSLFPDADNFRLALKWSIANGETGLAVGLAADLARFWYQTGVYREAWAWFAQVLEMPDLERTADLANVLRFAVGIGTDLGYLDESERLAERERDAVAELSDPGIAARSLNLRGGLAWRQGRLAEALALYEEALEVPLREDDWFRVQLLLNLGFTALGLARWHVAESVIERLRAEESMRPDIDDGEIDRLAAEAALARGTLNLAQDLIDRSLGRSSALNAAVRHAVALQTKAWIGLAAGGLEEAGEAAAESIRQFEEIGDRFNWAETQIAMAWIKLQEEDVGDAADRLRECLRTFAERRPMEFARSLIAVAAIAARGKQIEAAAHLALGATAQLATTDLVLSSLERDHLDTIVEQVSHELDPTPLVRIRHRAQEMTPNELLELTLQTV